MGFKIIKVYKYLYIYSILYEFEKGADILSLYGSDDAKELIWGTLKHYTKRMPFNKNKYG